MLRNVLPAIEPALDEEGEVDVPRAIVELDAAVAQTLDGLRAQMERLNRFDLIRRLAFREVAFDPDTYVEHEHDGMLSVVLLAMAVASEFETASAEEPDPCSDDVIELVHETATRAVHLANLLTSFQRNDSPAADAAGMVLLREVNWGPPSWHEDQDDLMSELFEGPVAPIMRKVTGFGPDDLFAVIDAVATTNTFATIAALSSPAPFLVQRAGIHHLAEVEESTVDRVLSWFSTGLGQPRVTDVFRSIRDRRMKPVLTDGDYVCWVTPDLFVWAIQLSFEDVLKGTADFNRYQRHRSAVVERRAVAAISAVLDPDVRLAGKSYSGSQGAGEVDGLLVIDRTAIVVEAKAQMLASRARSGDALRLEHNLDEIIGKGSEQIGRFIRTLRTDGRVSLDDGEVVIDSEAIDRVFGIVVTLDELNAIGVSTVALADLGAVLDEDALPVILSLHGLTEACRLLDRPWSLLHYLHRRRESAARVDFFAPEELDVLMLYIRMNLFFDELPAGTVVEVGVETDPLDAWSMYRRGLRKAPARKPGQKLPLHVQRLIDGLERCRPRGWTEALYPILDYGAGGRAQLGRQLKLARGRVRADGFHHDCSMGSESGRYPGGVSVVLGTPDSMGLDSRGHFLAHLNGLRSDSAQRWVGIAAEVDGELVSPTSVTIAQRPFEQVVAPGRDLFPPAWSGREQRIIRRPRRE